MGMLFDRKPNAYAPPPPQNALPPTFLGQTPGPETAPATDGRRAVAVDLPGQPGTYLDSEFAPKIDAFVKYAREEGHELTFESAYRRPERQKYMVENNISITPAPNSLHKAGFAVDVAGWAKLPEASKLAIRKAAERAGLSWGGAFMPSDPVHFYFDPIPGKDRTDLINNFTERVRRIQTKR